VSASGQLSTNTIVYFSRCELSSEIARLILEKTATHQGLQLQVGDDMKVLILGGTGDANRLAAKVASLPNTEVITSLAGRTRNPTTVGQMRIGSFGGILGLVDYLQAEKIDLLIDATHPFAAQISWNAAAAAEKVGVPRLMLIRPSWETSANHWIEV
jgi:precorrin-6A/cobalt-precorrin-6A reductase